MIYPEDQPAQKFLSTLDHRVLVTTEDEAREIARLVGEIGRERALGIIRWGASRVSTRPEDAFEIEGYVIIRALQPWAPTTAPNSSALNPRRRPRSRPLSPGRPRAACSAAPCPSRPRRPRRPAASDRYRTLTYI